MLISIITVNYNDVVGLEKTIQSVQSQTYRNFEHIIIDGNSNDGSKEVIKKYKDSFSYWVSEPDSGIYNAMNKGIDKAKGDYLLFLNSGDWLYSVKVLYEFIEFNPIEDIVYGDCLIYKNGSLLIKKMPDKMGVGKALTNTINHQSILFNKNLFKGNKRYDCSYKVTADWVFVNNAIIYQKCSTRHINLIIPIYDANGISSDLCLRVKDRNKYLESNFNNVFIDLLKDYNELNARHIKLKSKIKNLKNNVLVKLLIKTRNFCNSLKPKF